MPAHSPPPDLLVILPVHPLPSAAPSRLLCCSLLFPAAGAAVIIKGMGGLMRAQWIPLAHCGCCMLLLLLPPLQTPRSEPREPRRWRTHWPPGRTPTAPGHTTTPSPTWALEVRLPRRPTPLPPDLLVIPPDHPLLSAAPLRLLCRPLLFPAAGACIIIKGVGGLMGAVLRPPCSLWLLHVAASASGAAGNMIGDEGAEALAGALAPRQNPDGTWTHNNALTAP